VPRHSGQGLEAAAREARYRAYRECLQPHGEAGEGRYLALAHHRRDQAETLLFNLCRGAGVSGVAAMSACSLFGGITLLRPLLECDAGEIAAHAARQQLAWVEDESNQDERYDRNFLRHAILPPLKTRFSAVETTLARAAGHFAEAGTLLAELAALDDEKINAPAPSVRPAPVEGGAMRVAGWADSHQKNIPLDNLRRFSPARQANWLRYWLKKQGWHVPAAATLTEILRQLACVHATDNRLAFPFPEGQLRLWQGRLYCVPDLPAPPEPCAWDGQTPLIWAGGILHLQSCPGEGINALRLTGKILQIRPRQGGETLRPALNRPHRPLKKLLQESRLPPWQRERLPLLYLNNVLLACPGVAIAAEWQCAAHETGLVPVWESTKTSQIQV
ncbi:MAG: tRNA lysidine(34) synthetase TilS, partial [Zoogloeaceae bacterium]|jgi:tRNA(Ile)-lysidine synthase|nr:tRNA lysidine(34) synthetase TilS [Zoogloeaceae bacterium]